MSASRPNPSRATDNLFAPKEALRSGVRAGSFASEDRTFEGQKVFAASKTPRPYKGRFGGRS